MELEYKKSDLENDLSLTPDKVSGTINQDFQPEIGKTTMNNLIVANTNTQISTKNCDKYSEYNSPEKKEALKREALELAQALAKPMEKNYELKHSSSAKNTDQPQSPKLGR